MLDILSSSQVSGKLRPRFHMKLVVFNRGASGALTEAVPEPVVSRRFTETNPSDHTFAQLDDVGVPFSSPRYFFSSSPSDDGQYDGLYVNTIPEDGTFEFKFRFSVYSDIPGDVYDQYPKAPSSYLLDFGDRVPYEWSVIARTTMTTSVPVSTSQVTGGLYRISVSNVDSMDVILTIRITKMASGDKEAVPHIRYITPDGQLTIDDNYIMGVEYSASADPLNDTLPKNTMSATVDLIYHKPAKTNYPMRELALRCIKRGCVVQMYGGYGSTPNNTKYRLMSTQDVTKVSVKYNQLVFSGENLVTAREDYPDTSLVPNGILTSDNYVGSYTPQDLADLLTEAAPYIEADSFGNSYSLNTIIERMPVAHTAQILAAATNSFLKILPSGQLRLSAPPEKTSQLTIGPSQQMAEPTVEMPEHPEIYQIVTHYLSLDDEEEDVLNGSYYFGADSDKLELRFNRTVVNVTVSIKYAGTELDWGSRNAVYYNSSRLIIYPKNLGIPASARYYRIRVRAPKLNTSESPSTRYVSDENAARGSETTWNNPLMGSSSSQLSGVSSFRSSLIRNQAVYNLDIFPNPNIEPLDIVTVQYHNPARGNGSTTSSRVLVTGVHLSYSGGLKQTVTAMRCAWL